MHRRIVIADTFEISHSHFSYDKCSNISSFGSCYFAEADCTACSFVFGNTEESDQVALVYSHHFSICNKWDVIITRLFTRLAICIEGLNQLFIGETI